MALMCMPARDTQEDLELELFLEPHARKSGVALRQAWPRPVQAPASAMMERKQGERELHTLLFRTKIPGDQMSLVSMAEHDL